MSGLPIIFPEIKSLMGLPSSAERTLEERLARWREMSEHRLEGTPDITDQEIIDVFSPSIVDPYRYLVGRYRKEGDRIHHDGSWPEEHATRVGEIIKPHYFGKTVELAGLYHCFVHDLARNAEDIGRLDRDIRKQTNDVVAETVLEYTNKPHLLLMALRSNGSAEIEVGKLMERIRHLETRLGRKRVIHYAGELQRIKEYLERKSPQEKINLSSMEISLNHERLVGAFVHSGENRKTFYVVSLAHLIDDMSTSELMSAASFVGLAEKAKDFLEFEFADQRVDMLKTTLAYATMRKIYERIRAGGDYLVRAPDSSVKLMAIYGYLRNKYGENILKAMKSDEAHVVLSIRYKLNGRSGMPDFSRVWTGLLGDNSNLASGGELTFDGKVLRANNLVVRGVTPEGLRVALEQNWASLSLPGKPKYEIHPPSL